MPKHKKTREEMLAALFDALSPVTMSPLFSVEERQEFFRWALYVETLRPKPISSEKLG